MSSQTVYFITGVNRGIGLSLVRELIKDPKNVVIGTVRNEKAAASLPKSDNLHLIFIDMKEKYSAFESKFKKLESFPQIDYFIHNAGVGGPFFLNSSFEYDVDAYDDILAVNVGGAAKTYKAAYPYLFKSSAPKKIVFLSTIVASTGDYKAGANAYGASKAALNHFGVQVANELGNKSSVLLLHPGLVDTDMGTDVKPIFGADNFIHPDVAVKSLLKTVYSLASGFVDTEGTVFKY